MNYVTTLWRIEARRPCAQGWYKLLLHLGKTRPDDEPLPLSVILDSNGLADTLWCLRTCDYDVERDARLFAVWCVRQVQHLTDHQPALMALDVAERFANGEATARELRKANITVIHAEKPTDKASYSVVWAAIHATDWYDIRCSVSCVIGDIVNAIGHAHAGGRPVGSSTPPALNVTALNAQNAVRAAQLAKFREMFCTDDRINQFRSRPNEHRDNAQSAVHTRPV